MKITHVHGMCESSYKRFMNNEGKQSGAGVIKRMEIHILV